MAILDSNTEIFPPNQFAAPAAHVQAFVSGVIATRIPDQARWIQTITSDPKLSKIRDIVNNPSTLNNKSLAGIDYNYHAALRQSLIVMKDDILIYHEPLAGVGFYTRLQLVPLEFRNILFIAFHANPTGSHLNAYRTLHCLCLWYYWPGMYLYIKKCVPHAPVVRYQTLLRQNRESWFIISPSKPHFWYCMLMHTWLVPIPVSRDSKLTSLLAAGCALLVHWSLSLGLAPLHLRPPL